MRADLASILSDLETLTTEQALKRKFDQTFSNLGFNAFTYLGFRMEPSDVKRAPSDIIFLSNVRPAWIDHYVEEDLGEEDLLIKDASAAGCRSVGTKTIAPMSAHPPKPASSPKPSTLESGTA